MNEVTNWTFGENEVRTIEINNEPWWVLKDVCTVLELGSPHKVADRLEEDEKGRNLIPTLGGGIGRTTAAALSRRIQDYIKKHPEIIEIIGAEREEQHGDNDEKV